jgi:DNA (cytosine-5)-methyltransferase 1
VVIRRPTCQGFSNLGSKHLDDPRNRLWRQFLRVVAAARPQVFLIENVDRFRRSTEVRAPAREHPRLRAHNHGVLQAADYGCRNGGRARS